MSLIKVMMTASKNADKFKKLRKLKGAARTEEIRKYVNDAGELSLLKVLDKNATSSSRLSFSTGLIQQANLCQNQPSPFTPLSHRRPQAIVQPP